nr:MAG TPA: hypothetical protein [Bacteriophage sp.]
MYSGCVYPKDVVAILYVSKFNGIFIYLSCFCYKSIAISSIHFKPIESRNCNLISSIFYSNTIIGVYIIRTIS